MKRLLPLALAALSTSAFGAGLALNEVSARGNALQGALVGSTRDASAAYFNPANFTELGEGVHMLVGATFVRPAFDTRVHGITTPQKEKVFTIPHLYLVTPLSDDFYAGLGCYSEFGLGTRYEGLDKWILAPDSFESTVESFTLNPSIAWKATDKLSVAAGLRLMYLSMVTDRVLPAGTPPLHAPVPAVLHLRADAWAPSYVLALAYQITDTLRFGFLYRGQSDFDADGIARLSPLGINADVSGDIDLPSALQAGLNWQATKRLNFGLAVTRTDWTCYDKLAFTVKHPAVGKLPIVEEKDWEAAMRYSGGIEYQIDDHWSAQIGYTHDKDPTRAGHPDTLLPPGDRDQVGFGVGYGEGSWRVNVDYMLVIIHGTTREILGQTTNFRKVRTDTIGLSFAKTF